VLSRLQRPIDLLQMEIGRRTDINNIDIWPATNFRKAPDNFPDPVFCGQGRSALDIEVAKNFDFKKVWNFLKTSNMGRPDSGADNGDFKRITHAETGWAQNFACNRIYDI
jgi:hypothetical protein